MTVALDGYLFVISLSSADPLPRLSVNDGIIWILAGPIRASSPWKSFKPRQNRHCFDGGNDSCWFLTALEDPRPLGTYDLRDATPSHSRSVYCHLERIPKHTGLQVALPRAAPDVVIALHQLPHKLQTTTVGHDRSVGWTLPPIPAHT